MLQYEEYRANVNLTFFLQLPDSSYASNSKCLLQFTDSTALMQTNVESTPVLAQWPQPADIFGGRGKRIVTCCCT